MIMSDSDSEDEKKLPEVQVETSDSSYEEEEEEEEEKPPQDEKTEAKENLGQVQSLVGKMATPTTVPAQPRRKRFVPKYEAVEGTHRVILNEEAQLYIEIAVGSHVNAQYPWKFVAKSKIMEWLDLAGESSGLYHLREELKAYEDKLVLMGYIPDESKDYEEFYICCNKESRDHCKQQSDKFIGRQEKKLEKALQKKPKPWTSLGSEREITELVPFNTRPLMEVEVKAKFPTLYDPKEFVARDVLKVRCGYIELTPYRQKFNNVFRRRIHSASQIGLPKADRAAQTVLRYPQNMWTQSIADALGKYDPNAGGDLDDFFREYDSDESSDDDVVGKQPFDEIGFAQFRAAFARLRRLSYVKMLQTFLTDKISNLEDMVELNMVMDIYSNDYPNLVAQKTLDIYDTMTFEEYVCFTDVRAKDKYVSCAVFHPMWSGIVGICYSDGSPNIMKSVSRRPDPIQRAVYGLNPVMIWSHIDSLRPKLYLECTREVKVLAFCPFNENILVGGCVNGQVVIWDLTNKLQNVETILVLSETREKYKIAMNAHMGWMKNIHDDAVVKATAMSALLPSHYGAVTAISWLSPNFKVTSTGRQMKVDEEESKSLMIFTGSEDGTILIWNLSTENVTLLGGKKVKKSKRVLTRPSGLLVDVSPFTVLDRNFQPCYKLILGVAGHPQTLPLQTLAMNSPAVKYSFTPNAQGTGRKYFKCEVLYQSADEISNILYCGSRHGELTKISWEGHAFNTGELVNSEHVDVLFKCKIHDGIISCIQKNPFINHLTLTVGGKIFALWSDNLTERPLVWKKRPFRLTDGRWSLYKPSLLFISTSEGNLETWDILLRSDQPISVQTLSGSQLTGVSVHSLPVPRNLIGVSDSYGSFKMFIDPPIFMINNPAYLNRMEKLIDRELYVMQSFHSWQNNWMKNNPQILLEMRRKEGALLAEKEEEKRKLKEEEEKRLEEEAEERRHARSKVVGTAERWEMIIQKLIERTIAVKKRINRAELIENEKPLQELEAQRLEKERRMLEIMKNQKTIFNDTVAILFPEAIKKPPKVRKTFISLQRNAMKKEYMEDYKEVRKQALRTVRENPYRVSFSWEATLAEGKERRQALNAHETFIKMHKCRLEERYKEPSLIIVKAEEKGDEVAEEDAEEQ